MKKRVTIHRTRIGDIVAEFCIPPSRYAKKGNVAVLVGGAPSMPGKGSLMEFLAEKGYYVINPRYRGTWESGGTFLAGDPTDDIRDVVEASRTSLESLYESKRYTFPTNPRITLFASSFGGPAAFFLSTLPHVERVIAFSPVCDWTARSATEPLEAQNDFIKLVYGEGYRLSKKGWMRLARGNFYNPMNAVSAIDGSNILIFHAEDDTVVPVESVKRFGDVVGARIEISRRGGHYGLSEAMNPETWQLIARFRTRR